MGMHSNKRRDSSTRSERVANALLIATYAMYLFCSAFHFSTFDFSRFPILNMWMTSTYEIATFVLLIVVISLRRWRWSPLGLLGAVGILAVFLLSAQYDTVRPAAILLLILLAMGEMDFLPFAKVSFWTTLTLLVVFLVGTHVFGMMEWWDLLDGGYVSGRGAVHPNAYSILVFNLTLCMSMIVDRRRHLLLVVVGILASIAFVHFIQRSDTTFILLILLLALVLVERWWPALSRIVCKPPIFFASLAIAACALTAFMLVSAALYSPDNAFLAAASKMIHGRIALPSRIVREYGGYPVFGRPLSVWTGSAHASRMLGLPIVMLDSTYIRYALVGGLLMVMCTLGLFMRTAYVIGHWRPSLFVWGVFMIMLVYMVMEYDPSNPCFNATLPLLAYGLRPRRDGINGVNKGRENLC